MRLYGIGCPGTGQPFGTRAKQFTSSKILGKTVTIYTRGTDRYGRTLAWVLLGPQCINSQLLSTGLGWWYNQYAPDAPGEWKLNEPHV